MSVGRVFYASEVELFIGGVKVDAMGVDYYPGPGGERPRCAVCKRPVQWIGSSRVEELGRTYWRVRCHGAEEETWLDDAEAVRAGSRGVVIGEAFAGTAPRLDEARETSSAPGFATSTPGAKRR